MERSVRTVGAQFIRRPSRTVISKTEPCQGPAARIDTSVLRHLTDQDLKELGVSLGHRRKMLAAIAELGGAVPASPQPTFTGPKTRAFRLPRNWACDMSVMLSRDAVAEHRMPAGADCLRSAA
jgi:hypothetical protein